METSAYSESLRLLADWYEQHPEIPTPSDDFSVYSLDTKEEAATLIRALGSCDKDYNEYNATISKRFGALTLRFVFNRTSLCVRKVVGVETIPARLVPEHIEPAKTKEIVEWDCGSLLKEAP